MKKILLICIVSVVFSSCEKEKEQNPVLESSTKEIISDDTKTDLKNLREWSPENQKIVETKLKSSNDFVRMISYKQVAKWPLEKAFSILKAHLKIEKSALLRKKILVLLWDLHDAKGEYTEKLINLSFSMLTDFDHTVFITALQYISKKFNPKYHKKLRQIIPGVNKKNHPPLFLLLCSTKLTRKDVKFIAGYVDSVGKAGPVCSKNIKEAIKSNFR